jgi:hypothetical protein
VSGSNTARGLVLAVAAAVAIADAPAQTLTNDPFAGLPTEVTGSSAARPTLIFQLVAEIALPGPLPGPGPRWNGETVEIAVAGGTAVVVPEPDAIAGLVPGVSGGEDDPAEQRWAENSRGKLRFRTDSDGWVRAEKRCKRCKRGWKKKWRLRGAGAPGLSPLVLDRRVCYGGMDNRVYCNKARNGHRIWAVNVGGRVSERLVHWAGVRMGERSDLRLAAVSPDAVTAILAILEQGSELVALSEADGFRIGALKLAAGEGKLVSVPVTTPDGRIVAARQSYAESDAALLVYRLIPPVIIEPPPPGEGS